MNDPYLNWIKTTFPESFLIDRPAIDHLYLDLNSIVNTAFSSLFGKNNRDPRIAEAVHRSDFDKLGIELKIKVETALLEAIKWYAPRYSVNIISDGLMTLAEMQACKQQNYLHDHLRPASEVLDRHGLFPGAPFSSIIEDYIKIHVVHDKSLPERTILSLQSVSGSALAKILAKIRSNKRGASLIYSMERYTNLLLGSLLIPEQQIYLFYGVSGKTLNVTKVRSLLEEKSPSPAAADDFVILSLLMGSSFLPGIPSLERTSVTLTLLYEKYLAFNNLLIAQEGNGTRHINWPVLNNFLLTLSEPDLLAAMAAKEYDPPFTFHVLKKAMTPQGLYVSTFRSLWYKKALGPWTETDEDESFAKEILGIINAADRILGLIPGKARETLYPSSGDRIRDMTMDYLTSLGWIYLFLREGPDAVNEEWYYGYHYAPLLIDITTILEKDELFYKYGFFTQGSNKREINLIHQLIATTPFKSARNLPTEYRELFEPNSSILDLYPLRCMTDLSGKRKEKEGVILTPFIDLVRLKTAVDLVMINKQVMKTRLLSAEGQRVAQLKDGKEDEYRLDSEEAKRRRKEAKRIAEEAEKREEEKREARKKEEEELKLQAEAVKVEAAPVEAGRGRGVIQRGGYQPVSSLSRGGSIQRGRGTPRGSLAQRGRGAPTIQGSFQEILNSSLRGRGAAASPRGSSRGAAARSSTSFPTTAQQNPQRLLAQTTGQHGSPQQAFSAQQGSSQMTNPQREPLSSRKGLSYK